MRRSVAGPPTTLPWWKTPDRSPPPLPPSKLPEVAPAIATQFVAMMHLGHCPANHEREFPEVVRVEGANSYFDAAEPLLPIVESIEQIDEIAVE